MLLTRSPQTDVLAHVRILKSKLVNVCHVYDSRMALINLVSGSNLETPKSGIWSLNDEDFRR